MRPLGIRPIMGEKKVIYAQCEISIYYIQKKMHNN